MQFVQSRNSLKVIHFYQIFHFVCNILMFFPRSRTKFWNTVQISTMSHNTSLRQILTSALHSSSFFGRASCAKDKELWSIFRISLQYENRDLWFPSSWAWSMVLLFFSLTEICLVQLRGGGGAGRGGGGRCHAILHCTAVMQFCNVASLWIAKRCHCKNGNPKITV